MIAWFTEAMIASTLLMLAVMAVRKPAARLFGPRIAYALWLLPALRMILPPMPQSVVEATPLPLMAVALPSAAEMAHRLGHVSHIVAAPASVDWTVPLAWAWLAGAFFTFALALIGHGRFLRAIRTSGQRIGDVDGVPLWSSSAVEGPLAFGFVAPGVAVPFDFLDRYAPDERAFVLRHEAMHHRRCDLAVNLAALAVRSIHWLNPIAYWAHRAFRDDQELACDAAVLANESAPGRQAYGWALVKSACGAFPAAACAMDGKGQLKRRLAMMNRKTNTRSRALAGGAVIALVIGTGLGLTASNSIAAPAPKAVERFVSAAAPLVHAIPVMTPLELHIIERSSRVVAPLAPEVPPVLGLGSVPSVPPVPPLPRAVSAPYPPAAPAAPIAPESPEPPAAADSPDRYGIDATVRAAMAQARAAIAQSHAEIAQARAERALCQTDRSTARCGGVDRAAIRRDVAEGLRESLAEVRAERDIPRDMRARIVASIEREIARFERD